MRKRAALGGIAREKRVLWCTDTIKDLNGAALMLQRIGWAAHEKGRKLKIVTSLPAKDLTEDLPPCIINLPHIHHFSLPHYESYVLRVPSLLRSLREISSYEPDEIIVSTPGPVGLAGVIAAKYLKTPCIGVYHTDFYLQAKDITGEEGVASLLDNYTKWFYSLMDEIRVPTREYLRLMEQRGFDRTKLRLLKRGIDADSFSPTLTGRSFLQEQFRVRAGITLLFAGRVSKDKNLDFLLEVFKHLAAEIPLLSLVIAGNGPYLKELQRRNAHPRIIWTGQLRQNVLADVYSGADLFVFPSTTDTFGMAVLEAQACGIPAIVSDKGGPKEVIVDGETGFVVRAGDLLAWKHRIESMIYLILKEPGEYMKMKEKSRQNTLSHASWSAVIDDMIGSPRTPEARTAEMLSPMLVQ